jgi:hypothetical protein
MDYGQKIVSTLAENANAEKSSLTIMQKTVAEWGRNPPCYP